MAAVVDQTNPSADRRSLHQHLTGQLTLADAGLVGVEFTSGLLIAPVHCGVWIPPGTPHNGVLGNDAKTINLHIAPRAAAALPATPVRFLLNPMTTAMIRHLAVRHPQKPQAEAITRVILGELHEARHLPVNTAPFPNDPRLQHIALACTDHASLRFTNADWAKREAMSERTHAYTAREKGNGTLTCGLDFVHPTFGRGERVIEWEKRGRNRMGRRLRKSFGLHPDVPTAIRHDAGAIPQRAAVLILTFGEVG